MRYSECVDYLIIGDGCLRILTLPIFCPDLLYSLVMGKLVGPPLSESDQHWIAKQKIFFHATAAVSKNHRVNVSPKSAENFRVVDEKTVCWLDLSGSGSETAAHVMQNSRLTVMFVALEGPPKILRMYGKGEIIFIENLRLEKYRNVVTIFDKTRLPIFALNDITVQISIMIGSCRVRKTVTMDFVASWFST